MRVVISEKEYLALKKIQAVYGESNTFGVVSDLVKKIETEKQKETSAKKVRATKKATKTREDKAKRKILDAINMKRMYGDKITVYSIAKEAGVSFNTAKKYKDIIGKG